MTAARQLETLTLREYEELPGDARVEVIGGIVYDMAGASIRHQEISGELYYRIKDYLKRKKGHCRIFFAPTDVKLRERPLTIVQPDLFVVCDPNKINEKRVNGAPDWIIEIASPGNTAYDYLTKLNLYRDYRVREYWVVNPMKSEVMVYRLNGPKKDFDFQIYSFKDTVPVGIYEDLSIDFSEIEG
ncbi:MAG: Uma2 family endonuclease [Lachnospiraceae bacterium]|nr:Uma2 family endonuclease [Lachnospiraceae bacterium]